VYRKCHRWVVSVGLRIYSLSLSPCRLSTNRGTSTQRLGRCICTPSKTSKSACHGSEARWRVMYPWISSRQVSAGNLTSLPHTVSLWSGVGWFALYLALHSLRGWHRCKMSWACSCCWKIRHRDPFEMLSSDAVRSIPPKILAVERWIWMLVGRDG